MAAVSVAATGRVFSWGNNDDGQTGRESTPDDIRRSVNVQSAFEVGEIPLPGPVRSVSAGFATCAIFAKPFKGDSAYNEDDLYNEEEDEEDEEHEDA